MLHKGLFKFFKCRVKITLIMYCNRICSKYAVKKLPAKYGGLYEAGHKRCSSCEIYLIWNKVHCPCCGCVLRSKPRNAKARGKLVEMINARNS